MQYFTSVFDCLQGWGRLMRFSVDVAPSWWNFRRPQTFYHRPPPARWSFWMNWAGEPVHMMVWPLHTPHWTTLYQRYDT